MVGLILSVVISLRLVPVDTLKGFIKWIDIDTTNDSIRWALTSDNNHPIVYKDGKEYRRFPYSIITPETIIVWVDNETDSVYNVMVHMADRYGNIYKEVSLASLLRPYYEDGYTYIGHIDYPWGVGEKIDTIYGKLSDAGGEALDTQFVRIGLTFYNVEDTISQDEWSNGFEKVWWVDIVHMRVYEDSSFPLNRAVYDGVKRYGDSLYVLTRDLHLHKYIVNSDGSLTEIYDVITPYAEVEEALNEPDNIEMRLSANGKYIEVSTIIIPPPTFSLYYASDGSFIGYFTRDSFEFIDTGYKNQGVIFSFPYMDTIRGGMVFGEYSAWGCRRVYYYCIDSMKVLNSYKVPEDNLHWAIAFAHPLDSYGKEMIVEINPMYKEDLSSDTIYIYHVDSTGNGELMFTWSKKGLFSGGYMQSFYINGVQYLSLMYRTKSILYRIVR